MKIPASSSLLFATLAISSSSTSLAAPAGESSQATGMSTSSSNHHMASRRGSFNIARSDVDGAEQKRSIPCAVEALLPVVGPVLAPIINGLLGITCDPQAQSVASEASVENVSSASGAGDSGDNSNQDPNAPHSPSLPSQSPPPPPNTPSPPSAPTSPQRRDVPGDIRGRSLPPRDGSADGDQKPLDAVSQTTSSPTDKLKGAAGSAESHVPPAGGAVGESDSAPVKLPADHVPNPPANLGQTPEAAKGELPNAHNTPVGGAVEDKLPAPVAGAAGTAESAPPKRGTPEW
ncbi:hypothetical protein F5146DRAFT_230357 [Armillaria mellea]|nr:hypothetical protein F5146DRAFT_230357 [Armillaria mellea]